MNLGLVKALAVFTLAENQIQHPAFIITKVSFSDPYPDPTKHDNVEDIAFVFILAVDKVFVLFTANKVIAFFDSGFPCWLV